MNKRIAELEAEVKELQSQIATLLEAQSVTNKYDSIDTVPMPRNFSLRQKIKWTTERRNDGSGKLNRTKIVGDCIYWTGRLKGQYAIIDHMDFKYRVHTLAKIIATTPEVEPSWKDDIEISAAYKQKTQVEKLVGAHQCHNKSCCNPDHVEFRTHAENRQESFYSARQTKGSEVHQELVYKIFLEMTDFKLIKDQLLIYTKSIGMNVSNAWAYSLVRGIKYLNTPLGQKYKPLLVEKWKKINESNSQTTFPSYLV